MQIVAFGLGLMVLLLLAVVRTGLLADWRRTLPADLPNFFFINIPPQQRAELLDFMASHGAKAARTLPMIRARLTQINGKPVALDAFRRESAARASPSGKQNITWDR